MKDLAPYGQHLSLQKNSYEIVIIFMGQKSSERAHSFQNCLPNTLYLPFKTSPYDFYWPLTHCDVYLVDTGFSTDSFIKHCVLCFVSHGAGNVTYVSSQRVINFLKE